MFDKILIANRGEIAVRIINTCKRMNIRTVAVFSEADFRSPYVSSADESCFIGPAKAQESYLDKKRVIEAALSSGCQAIHPGYGFLSENPEFAEMVGAAGLVFIGPSVSAIAILGDKIASKQLALKAGVPIVPGHEEPLTDLDEALAVAQKIGFPLLLKPAAGGGGRGMRIVSGPEELASALSSSRRETMKAFGDDRIFMERYVKGPRHIEFQIMADNYGNVIHLGERECSIQRRYQKVVEETPSPVLNPELRRSMGDVACRLAEEVKYSNAGTVEFILDADRNYYFLEMNTRLQVEHPITEMVTSLDLVELQLRVAAGERLPITQEEVSIKGWAIEARVCAEDPSRGFLPTTGMITRYAVPKGTNLRVDSGIAIGSTVTIFYDSLLSKVAAWGNNRHEAISNMVRALNGYHIEGLNTNLEFCNAIINHPAFAAGDFTTGFIEDHFSDGKSKIPPDPEKLRLMTIAAALVHHARRTLVKQSLIPLRPIVGKEHKPVTNYKYTVRTGEFVFAVELNGDMTSNFRRFKIDGHIYEVVAPEFEYYRRRLKLKINNCSHMFRLQYEDHHIKTVFCGISRIFEVYSPLEWALTAHMLRDRKVVQENKLRCPMPGQITSIWVQEGADVRRGQELLRMESMKMEIGIASPCDGKVDKIPVFAGKAVETDEILLTFET